MLPICGGGAKPRRRPAGRLVEKSNLPGLMSSNPFVFLHNIQLSHDPIPYYQRCRTCISLLLPGAKRNEKRALALASATLSHTHIYAYSIILQLTVCRNVNTHPQEPLRFTTPRPPPPAPPYHTPGLFAVRRAARRYYDGSCAGGGLRIPVRVFIHSFPFRIRYAIISR